MQRIIILDFGSQYTQLIARRVRELNTYCEIHPFNKFPADAGNVIGVILSGSPFSVNDPEAPQVDLATLRGRWPLLGICYGAQYLARSLGGTVESADTREYGKATLTYVDGDDALMNGVHEGSVVWMSHGDTITSVPEALQRVGSTADVSEAAFRIRGEQSWGVQFHPEVYHSQDGMTLLRNFVQHICGSDCAWTPDSFIESTVADLRAKLGDDKVVLALSGGVDSTVAAMLLNRAIGDRLTCIFVDNGLLRLNEFSQVMEDYTRLGLNVIGVDAKEDFYQALSGVTDPERKRKIIGKGFIDIFDREAHKLQGIKWRRASADQERRRHGRRAHLRERRGPACRQLHRRHDGHLDTAAPRLPGRSLQCHHPPRARREPLRLRHLLQAALDHRVGIIHPLLHSD